MTSLCPQPSPIQHYTTFTPMDICLWLFPSRDHYHHMFRDQSSKFYHVSGLLGFVFLKPWQWTSASCLPHLPLSHLQKTKVSGSLSLLLLLQKNNEHLCWLQCHILPCVQEALWKTYHTFLLEWFCKYRQGQMLHQVIHSVSKLPREEGCLDMFCVSI